MARQTRIAILVALALVAAPPAPAQDTARFEPVAKGSEAALAAAARFYAAVEPVPFTLTLNLALVKGDTADDPPARDAVVGYRDAGGHSVSLPIKVKTHGRWRPISGLCRSIRICKR